MVQRLIRASKTGLRSKVSSFISDSMLTSGCGLVRTFGLFCLHGEIPVFPPGAARLAALTSPVTTQTAAGPASLVWGWGGVDSLGVAHF